MAVGATLIAAGLALRLWAVQHIGPKSRTRDAEPPPRRVVTGPYRFTNHPLYFGNGVLSEGLAIAGGAGRSWLPVVFPLLWLVQYGPIMLWERSQLRAVKDGNEKGQGPALTSGHPHASSVETAPEREQGAADMLLEPAPAPAMPFRDAVRSERRTHQAVVAFLVASLVSGFVRHLRERRRGS